MDERSSLEIHCFWNPLCSWAMYEEHEGHTEREELTRLFASCESVSRPHEECWLVEPVFTSKYEVLWELL